MIKLYPLNYYSESGNLNPPRYFYLSLLFLARTWILLIISVVSRSTGDKLLGIFYPDKFHFYAGLASGFIALLLFFLAGRDHDKQPFICKCWQKGYLFLLLGVIADLVLQLYYLQLNHFQYSVSASIQIVVIGWILIFTLTSKHLKDAFKRGC